MRFILYKDTQGQFRWRLEAANNRIIAHGGEGYHNKADCVRAMNLVAGTNQFTPVDDITTASTILSRGW